MKLRCYIAIIAQKCKTQPGTQAILSESIIMDSCYYATFAANVIRRLSHLLFVADNFIMYFIYYAVQDPNMSV